MKIRASWSTLVALVWISSASAIEPMAIRQIRGCNADQERALRVAESDLLDRLTQVQTELPRFDLRYVYENFIIPNDREWFEGSSSNLIYQRYLSQLVRVFTLMEQDTRQGLNFECKDNLRERQCQNGQVYAYVLFFLGSPRKTIYFCGEYFKLSPDEQKKTLLHELSHYSASTEDLALEWSGGPRSDISRAPKDAYHVQEFIEGDIERLLKRQIWLWNWKRKPLPTQPDALAQDW